MRSLYESNLGFKQFADRECAKHRCDVETLFTYSWVKNVADYYREEDRKRKNVVGVNSSADAEMGECK